METITAHLQHMPYDDENILVTAQDQTNTTKDPGNLTQKVNIARSTHPKIDPSRIVMDACVT